MEKRGIGQVCQIGYVVRDMKAALDFWVNVLGVGPWFVTEEVRPINGLCRGKPCDIRFGVALANWGDMQIELIEDHSPEPDFYQEFLSAGCNGIHHVSVWQSTDEDFAHAEETLKANGFSCAQCGAIGTPEGRFAYYDNPAYPGVIIEISSVNSEKGEKFRRIAEAARNWDGKDPIR